MRILLLTILFLTPLYFYTREDEARMPEIDSVKLKMGAPDRAERIFTVEKIKEEIIPVIITPTESSEGPVRDITSEDEGVEENLDQVEEVQWTDLEEGWNIELKGMLGRLEPAEGEEIYKTYMKAQESYQAELDALMNEKQQKTSDEAISEIDQLINQLDSKHQEKLKDVLGAHYEAVRDQYQQYMESAEEE